MYELTCNRTVYDRLVFVWNSPNRFIDISCLAGDRKLRSGRIVHLKILSRYKMDSTHLFLMWNNSILRWEADIRRKIRYQVMSGVNFLWSKVFDPTILVHISWIFDAYLCCYDKIRSYLFTTWCILCRYRISIVTLSLILLAQYFWVRYAIARDIFIPPGRILPLLPLQRKKE